MPNSTLKAFSKKYNVSVEELEKKWDKAKEIVIDEYGKDENDGDQFYKLATGILKKMIEPTDVNEDNNFFNEMVQTGSVEKSPMPMKKLPISRQRDIGDEPPVIRKPDLVGPYGTPAFSVVGDDIKSVKKLLDGKKKYQRWDDMIGDTGIRNWANKNPLKSFYVAHKGLFFKVR